MDSHVSIIPAIVPLYVIHTCKCYFAQYIIPVNCGFPCINYTGQLWIPLYKLYRATMDSLVSITLAIVPLYVIHNCKCPFAQYIFISQHGIDCKRHDVRIHLAVLQAC